jgi:hypothetical protein
MFQKETIDDTKHSIDKAVDAGTNLGQYISHGTLTFFIIGNQIVKYNIITKFATKLPTARLRENLQYII